MENYYDIAVVGVSRTGKSTFIASLFEDSIATKLKSFTNENLEGQTKVATHYWLLCTQEQTQQNELKLTSIEWNKEALTNYILTKDSKNEDLDNILDKLGFWNITEDEEDININNMSLTKYLESDDYKQKMFELSDDDCVNLINNGAIQDKNVITHIELSGPASKAVQEILTENGLTKLKLRDTRGFLDDSEKFGTLLTETRKYYSAYVSAPICQLQDKNYF